MQFAIVVFDHTKTVAVQVWAGFTSEQRAEHYAELYCPGVRWEVVPCHAIAQ